MYVYKNNRVALLIMACKLNISEMWHFTIKIFIDIKIFLDTKMRDDTQEKKEKKRKENPKNI